MVEQIRDALVGKSGTVDVGHTDPAYKSVGVEVTPGYAKWLEQNKGKDVLVMQTQGIGSFSSHGPGKFAVQSLVLMSLKIVENLIEAGVPEEVALRLLPHELYIASVGK
jgi:hypothetical protein